MNHEFLEHLVDYAGLFPPASLDLPAAVLEYVDHRTHPESWMLGRFICPVGRLAELHVFGDLFANHPLHLCVLPAPSNSLLNSVTEAVERSQQFVDAFSGQAEVDVFEARVPPGPVSLDDLSQIASAAGERRLYLEWPAADPALPQKLEAVGAARLAGAQHLGAKIRCGGVQPSAYPSVPEVARFISNCVLHSVPFKATAGLHHPVRHLAGAVTMHGFLNVFGAAVLARVHQLDQSVIEAIVGEMDPGAFRLVDGSMAWRSLTASISEVHSARVELAHSYGSCSFDDPTNDLIARDWFRAPITAE